MRRIPLSLATLVFLAIAASPIQAQANLVPEGNCSGTTIPAAALSELPASPSSVEWVKYRADEVVSKSYPEIVGHGWRVRTFHSDYDYFRTRFSIWRFFLPVPMRYYVEVNPLLFDRHAPLDGVCAILAHELVHVRDMSHGNRLHLLGLIRLLSTSYTVQFERKTDLEAIHRGWGEGLKSYRRWIYANIPAAKVERKRRTYFTPEEIDALEPAMRDPQLLAKWRKKVPLSLEEIKSAQSTSGK